MQSLCEQYKFCDRYCIWNIRGDSNCKVAKRGSIEAKAYVAMSEIESTKTKENIIGYSWNRGEHEETHLLAHESHPCDFSQ